MSKAKDAQGMLPDLFVPTALLEFQSEFRDVYPTHVMERQFTAVGPMETFLGFLVQRGMISVK